MSKMFNFEFSEEDCETLNTILTQGETVSTELHERFAKQWRDNIRLLGGEELTYTQKLLATSKLHLVNDVVNDYLREIQSYPDDQNEDSDDKIFDPHGHGKRIPYIGWFWRDAEFFHERWTPTLGDCGSFIGIMENNKWGYPQRNMTLGERDVFIEFIDRSQDAYENPRDSQEREQAREEVLLEMWEWFQGLEVPDNSDEL